MMKKKTRRKRSHKFRLKVKNAHGKDGKKKFVKVKGRRDKKDRFYII